jgi:uncharacterized protein (TIGR02147 family)
MENIVVLSLFDFSDYKNYLQSKFKQMSQTHKAFRSHAAEYIGCLPSYMSQVLNSKPNLTLEQAFKMNQLLSHDKLEAKYFILLVEFERAGTKDLQNYFQDQLNEIKASRFDLKKRLKDTEQLSEQHMNKYYSAWFYSAIHIALVIPEMQDVNVLARRFNLPVDIVVNVIGFLQECGLVIQENGAYKFTTTRIHLDRNSDFIQRHHINWRSQCLQSVEKNLSEDMHFSTVFTISKSDYNLVRESLITAIENARKIIRPSDSEELAAITLDLFRV